MDKMIPLSQAEQDLLLQALTHFITLVSFFALQMAAIPVAMFIESRMPKGGKCPPAV